MNGVEVGLHGFMSQSRASWDQYDSRRTCTFVIIEISRLYDKSNKTARSREQRSLT
jgi:hypothetical protein